MDAITTRGTAPAAPATTLVGEWRRFAAFLRRPVLPERAPLPALSSLVAIGRLLVLDLIAMASLLAVAGLVTASGVELPQTALAGMEMTGMVVLAAVLFAPIMEEIAFRGWLSGRPGHLLAWLACMLGAGAAVAAFQRPHGTQTALVAGAAVLVSIVIAAGVLYALRRRGPARPFAAVFAPLFWLSALVFASAHLLNFTADNMLTLLPLVLPQFAVGLLLGYARVTYGLWSSMLLHLLHNGSFVGLVAIATRFA